MSRSTQANVVVVDAGVVRLAAMTLVEESTLADHVTVTEQGGTTMIQMDTSIPYDQWGSGTQCLWDLLAAMSYRDCEVSLYECAARLDRPNSEAAARALSMLFASGYPGGPHA